MSVLSGAVHINGGLHGQQIGVPSKGDGTGIIIGADSHAASHLLTGNNEIHQISSLQGISQNNCHSSGYDHGGSGDAHAEESPEIDIIINNVVCTFSVRCHLNLKRIAMEGAHVEYRRENGMLNMKIRRPNTTATIWSSGKITCTGSTSEFEAKVAARKIARRLQKLGFNIRFSSYRVVNVLGTCSLPFGIKLNQFSTEHKQNSSYEPELHPGVTYRIKEPRATLKIFSTGSITVTAPSVLNVQLAIEHIYPLVCPFKMETSRVDKKIMMAEKKYLKKGGAYVNNTVFQVLSDDDEEEFFDEDELEDEESEFSEDFDSDVSCD